MDVILTGPFILFAGIGLFVLLVVQMLIGYRKIRFKGPLHLKVHKWLGWVIAVSAALHGTAGFLYLRGL